MDDITIDTEPYQEQTELKHKVIGDYFDKWVKILGVGFGGKINYVDGFAGLGAYKKEDEIFYGSPIIASEVIEKNLKFIKSVQMILIDKDEKVLSNLKNVFVSKNLLNRPYLNVQFIHEDFNKAMVEYLENGKLNYAPTFAFIDPFGFEAVHFDTIKRIMQNNNRSEFVINFMFNAVSRFLRREDLTETFNRFFGTNDWKETTSNVENREEILVNYYVSRLKEISKIVVPYRLRFPDKNRTYYYLIHLTNHPLGATIMKSSFAKYCQGRNVWLGHDSVQSSLEEILGIRSSEVKDLLLKKYKGKCISYEQIIIDNIGDTCYLDTHFKNAILELEKENKVFIDRYPKIGESGRPLKSIQFNTKLYFESFPSIERKTLLYETKVEYGNFTINHVFGCSHGCKYPCYAFLLARRYGRVQEYEQWLHPKIVSNALELLDKEIPQYKKKIDFVHLSFTTDPFMFDSLNLRVFPAISELTLKIIQKLNKEGIKVTVLTKGVFPKDLLDINQFNPANEYGITLVSLDKKFWKEYEPYSAPPEERIKSLELLHKSGLKTWVSIEPYPTPNIIKQNLTSILEKINFADKIIFGKMNYNKRVSDFDKGEEFFANCSNTVIEFCRKNIKQYHIKKGTPNNSSETAEIFGK